MENKRWCTLEDCEIIRRDDLAIVMTCDGDELFSVYSETHTDEHIWEIMRIANSAFNRGFNAGALAKINEIKRALNIFFLG